ncbi:MAG: methionyl-tRNA formyltransferase [Bacillota bacterium]|nr:methionyl-tRNA formyltransferase [Bacillota bacterium]
MRLVFMGTPEFAVPTLRAVAHDGHDILCVFTQPDRPAGRGHRLTPPPVKAAALELGLRVEQPRRVSVPDVVKAIREMRPDAVVVAAFGQKISPELLSVPKHGFLNVHPSLLPRYRGAAPVQRCLMNGDRVTGVTIMYMDEGWDTGDIGLMREVDVPDGANAAELDDVLAQHGAELMCEFLRLLEMGKAPRIPQDDSKATYAPKITDEDLVIDFRRPAESIRNQIRGLSPSPGASVSVGEIRFKILRAEAVPDWSPPQAFEGEVEPGMLWPERRCGLVLGCGPDGRDGLVLLEVQPAAGKAMGGAEFARGRRLLPGQRVFS